VAQVDAADEGDVELRPARMAEEHDLLMMGAGPPDPLVQQHLSAGCVHTLREGDVTLRVVADRLRVRSPEQAADLDAGAGQAFEEVAEPGAVGGEHLIVVTPPVREPQSVTRPQLA
jgi:hypothetical protein